jgi:predicted N-formylglutamate amidohydrolase
LVGERLAAGRETFLLAVHSFTPVYKGASRPWQIGVIHDRDMCLAGPILEALKAVNGITIGDNQPYSPADRVYYTLERHARSRGLPCAMIEIRNDEIGDESGQREWADLLAGILLAVKPKSEASALAGSVRGAGEEAGRGK